MDWVGELVLFSVAVVLFVAWVWAARKVDDLESDLAWAESRNGKFDREFGALRDRNRELAYEVCAMQERLDQASVLVGKMVPVVTDVEKGKAKLTEAEVDEAYAYANQLGCQREDEPKWYGKMCSEISKG